MAFTINGTPIDELGIVDPVISLANQGTDWLRFSVSDRAIDDADLFAYNDAVVLAKDGVVVFRGRCKSAPHFGRALDEGHDYEIANFWADLERVDYRQDWIQYGGGLATKTRVVLGSSYSGGSMSVGAVIKEVLYRTLDDFDVSFSYVSAELTALSMVPPWDERNGVKASEAIQIMLRWCPDCITWVDYSPSVPVLHFTRRGSADALQYNCTDGSIVGEIPRIAARNDIKFNGVVLYYERQNEDTVWNAVYEDRYPVDAPNSLDTVLMTIPLGLNGEISSAPSGLAQALHSAISVLHYEGEIVLAFDSECDLAQHPGQVLNLTGGLAAWETMDAVVQVVEHNLDRAETTISFGPPEHLSPQDQIELLNGNRKRNAGWGWGIAEEPRTFVTEVPPEDFTGKDVGMVKILKLAGSPAALIADYDYPFMT